jgi:hypothetical protein
MTFFDATLVQALIANYGYAVNRPKNGSDSVLMKFGGCLAL